MKQKIHNEHFEELLKKKCPNCEENYKKPLGNTVYWWFEYHNVKRYTVCHFCVNCFESRVKNKLLEHKGDCGCEIELVWHGYGLNKPEWLTL